MDEHSLDALRRLAQSTETIADQLRRLADHFDPPPPDVVDTGYVANRLGCTTAYITQLVGKGQIPSSCILAGTGNGKRWKFHRLPNVNLLVDRSGR